jgi:hypothetical protein
VGDDGYEHTRLFGCGYYRSHEYRNKNFSGRAWLGVKKPSRLLKNLSRPLGI